VNMEQGHHAQRNIGGRKLIGVHDVGARKRRGSKWADSARTFGAVRLLPLVCRTSAMLSEGGGGAVWAVGARLRIRTTPAFVRD